MKESVTRIVGRRNAICARLRANRPIGLRRRGPVRVTAVAFVALALTASAGGQSTPGFLSTAETSLAAFYKGKATAPPTTGPKAVKGKNVWVISCGQAVPGCSTQTNAAADAGRILGWKVHVLDGAFDANDAYDAGIRQAIAAGANGIILVSIDCGTVEASVKQAVAANIKVVTQSGFGCADAPSLTTGVDPAASTPTLASFGQNQGKGQADWIIAQTNGKAHVLNFVFVDNTFAQQINAGFLAEMQKCTSCTIATQDISLSDYSNPSLFQQKASYAVVKNPNANAIHVPFDSFVTGGVGPAVVNAGKASQIQVVAGEGFAANLILIRNHQGENAAAAYDQTWHGWAGADTLNRVFAGTGPAPEGEGIQMVDSTHNLPPAGQNYTSPVNFKADYEAVWGVSS